MTLKKKKKKRLQILKSCDFQCYFSVNILYPKYLNYRSKRLQIHHKNPLNYRSKRLKIHHKNNAKILTEITLKIT